MLHCRGLDHILSYLIYKGWADVKLADDNDEDFERVQKIVNSTVKLPSKMKSAKQKKISSDHQLSEQQRNVLKQKQLNDLRDILRLLCLNKGYQHRRLAHYLHCGSLDKYTVELGSCSGTCLTSPFNYEKESGCCGINLISEGKRKYKVLG